MKQIVPDIDKLSSYIKSKKIEFYEKSKVIIKQDIITIKPYINELDQKKMEKDEFVKKILKVLNSLETLSIYFNSGIADEKIAYLSIGSSYCFTVKIYLPDIVLYNNGNHYNNILILFNLWNARMEKDKIIKEKQHLDNKLIEIETRNIKPLGVDI